MQVRHRHLVYSGQKHNISLRSISIIRSILVRVPRLTFINVRGQAAHEHLAREALDALAVLVRVAVGGAQHPGNALVAVAVVKEIVVDGEERGAS